MAPFIANDFVKKHTLIEKLIEIVTGPAHHQPGWEGHLPSSRGIFLPADPGPSGLLGGDGRIQNCRVRRQTRRHLSQTQVSTGRFRRFGRCFIDWATAVVDEGDKFYEDFYQICWFAF